MALRRSNSLLGNSSKASGGMSFETAQGPHAAVLAMFPERAERTPLPPIPRLQLTAAEEKTRTTDFKVPSVQERLEYFASMPESSRPQTVGQQSNRPPLPAGLTPGMTVTVPGYTQYTMWYNDSRSAVHATLGMQLKPNTPISIHSPRVAQHTTLRQEAFKAVRDVLGKAIPTNLSQIVHLFMAQVTRQGSTDLTAASVTAALADLDVDDVIVADKFFSLLDVHKSGRVPITTIIAVVDLCINSDLFKARVREHCFNLFNLHGLGYIHSTQLDEVKAIMGKENTFRGSGATANMVRVLGDVFIAARKAEEEDYVNTVLLKKAKKKKKAPPLKPNQKSYIPATMRRIGHLDVDLFSKYFDSSLELASAFFPRYLALLLSDSHLQHASVMRAIALAEEAGQM